MQRTVAEMFGRPSFLLVVASIFRSRPSCSWGPVSFRKRNRRLLAMDVTIEADQITIKSHHQYTTPPFGPTSVDRNPFVQFRKWFADVQSPAPDSAPSTTSTNFNSATSITRPQVLEPEAMSLATSTLSGTPSVRMVLFKALDHRGFVFYTNYTSRKSGELLENPQAALCFYWGEVSRSVRIVGKVEKIDEETSGDYFKSRPIGSRVGAWASPQSQVVGEKELAERVKEAVEKFGVQGGEGEVPKPEFWGGWRVVPQ
jgi:pyridoxamine-phosphate oxidase